MRDDAAVRSAAHHARRRTEERIFALLDERPERLVAPRRAHRVRVVLGSGRGEDEAVASVDLGQPRTLHPRLVEAVWLALPRMLLRLELDELLRLADEGEGILGVKLDSPDAAARGAAEVDVEPLVIVREQHRVVVRHLLPVDLGSRDAAYRLERTLRRVGDVKLRPTSREVVLAAVLHRRRRVAEVVDADVDLLPCRAAVLRLPRHAHRGIEVERSVVIEERRVGDLAIGRARRAARLAVAAAAVNRNPRQRHRIAVCLWRRRLASRGRLRASSVRCECKRGDSREETCRMLHLFFPLFLF